MHQLSIEERDTLDRLKHMAVQGRLAEAELELHAWCRNGGPSEARVMLAALLARRNDMKAAHELLGEPHRSNPQSMNAEEAKLAVAVLVGSGLEDSARRLAAWLYHLHGDDPVIAQWIAVMDVPGLTDLPAVSESTIERLSDELAAQPNVVPSLVFSLKLAPRTRAISLLRAALTKMTTRFDGEPEMPRILQGLAELSLLIGDEDAARRWAHQGLRLEPYNATLALLLGQLRDDESVGPTAQQTLKRVAMKFPGYPDVQAAYARRVELDKQLRKSA